MSTHDCLVSSSANAAVNIQVPASATAPIIADFAEHAIRVAYVSRRDVARLPEAEWAAPGVYLLVSDDGQGNLYVGRSTGLRSRLLQRRSKNTQVPSWSRAVLAKRDTTNGFTSSDVGYLDGQLSAELEAIPGIFVAKGKAEADATLPPHKRMSLDALVSSILAAVRLAGIDVHRDDEEAELPSKALTRTAIRGTVSDRVAEGLLHAAAELHCGGKQGGGMVGADGQIIVEGVGFKAPSRAAGASLGAETSTGLGGWDMWHVGLPIWPTLIESAGPVALGSTENRLAGCVPGNDTPPRRGTTVDALKFSIVAVSGDHSIAERTEC